MPGAIRAMTPIPRQGKGIMVDAWQHVNCPMLDGRRVASNNDVSSLTRAGHCVSGPFRGPTSLNGEEDDTARLGHWGVTVLSAARH